MADDRRSEDDPSQFKAADNEEIDETEMFMGSNPWDKLTISLN